MEPISPWAVDPAWRVIDILSDVHLNSAMPRTRERWAAHLLSTPADAVLILGDLFEVWVGDDACASDFERDCKAVLSEAAAHRTVAFMPGNRDFLVGDTLLGDCGITRLNDPTLLQAFGHRCLLTHGDALCLADVDYQRFRTEVRSAQWQHRFLDQPLPLRQQQARAMRDASTLHQAGRPPGGWFDIDEPTACAWLASAHADTLIHGHTHRPAAHQLTDGYARYVLGDWDLDGTTPRAMALRLSSSGLEWLDLSKP